MKATYDDAMLTCTTLKSHGYDAFLAGGCVRDILLGVHANDYDITTSATPEQVQKVFERTIPVGISFGVVKVVCGENRELDVATFRTDGLYSDNRRPDTVQYSKSAEEDVRRRDFTINALLMDNSGKIIDHVGGQEDLRKGLLRTVGDPFARFAEDSLRMMRAIRFATKYNLDIERSTWNAIKALASNIKLVSKERVTDELIKMMTGGKADKAYWGLNACNLWDGWIGFGFDKYSDDKWHIMRALNMVDEGSDFAIPLAILLEPLHVSDRPTFKNKFVLTREQDRKGDSIIVKAKALTDFMIKSLGAQRLMLQDPEIELYKQFIRCKEWPYHTTIASSASEVLGHMDEISKLGIPNPIITGNDLIEWSYVQGAIYTSMLKAVEFEQLEDRVLNKEQARQFLLDKFRAAPRMQEDGTITDGMAPATYAAQCKQCRHTMSFEVSCKPNGEIDWRTIQNRDNVNLDGSDYYAHCNHEYTAEERKNRYYSKCYGKKAKHKFVRMAV